MKKLLLIAGILLSTNVLAGPLTNYDQIKAALISGNYLRMVIDFSNCDVSNNQQHPLIGFGAYTPNETIIDREGNIIASFNHFTKMDYHFPNQPVYQYVRYTIKRNDNATVSIQVLDAKSFKPLTEKVEVNCPIASGLMVYAAT